MEYAAAREIHDRLDNDVKTASVKLNKFPKHDNGLTPDDVKRSLEYQVAKATFDATFSVLRRFNKTFVVAFRKEIKAERLARWHRN